MKVYYAHPINYYNTTTEAKDIETLEKLGYENKQKIHKTRFVKRFCCNWSQI